MKAFTVEHTLYDFLDKVISFTPEDSTFYCFNPFGKESAGYYLYYPMLVKYYLYPRKIIMTDKNEEVRIEELLKSNYILFFYMPYDLPSARIESTISRLPSAQRIYRSYDDVYQALYRLQKIDTR